MRQSYQHAGSASVHDARRCPAVDQCNPLSHCRYCQDINDQADQEAFLEGLSGTPYVDFNCTIPLPYLYTIMVIEFVAYFVLALWLDNVVPNANGGQLVVGRSGGMLGCPT